MEDRVTPHEKRRDIYFNELFPLFRDIKGTADAILNLNQQNMYDANQSARHKATKAREQMYFLLILGAVLADRLRIFDRQMDPPPDSTFDAVC